MFQNGNPLNRGRNISLANSNTTDYDQGFQVSGFEQGGLVLECFALVASPEYTALVFLYFLLWSTKFCEVFLVFLLKPLALIKKQLDTLSQPVRLPLVF
jgi:hypothetical protein